MISTIRFFCIVAFCLSNLKFATSQNKDVSYKKNIKRKSIIKHSNAALSNRKINYVAFANISSIKKDECIVLDADNNNLNFYNIHDNLFILLYNQPNCSGCFKYISEYFKKRNTKYQLYILFPFSENAFERRKNIMYAEDNFPHFTICFDVKDTTSGKGKFFSFFGVEKTPAVVVFVKDVEKVYLITEREIFVETKTKIHFSKKMKKFLKIFCND